MQPPPFLPDFVPVESPLKGAHPVARQSRFHGCPGMACSAAFGTVACQPFRAMRAARRAMDN